MKKNYSEPKIKVQTIALQQMMVGSPGEWEDEPVIPIVPGEAGGDGDAKDNLLDGLFD